MAFVLKRPARPGDTRDPFRANVPLAPGANSSPQIPGQVPDRSSVPGEGGLPLDVPTGPVQRPSVESGTAQGIMHVFAARDGNDNDPARFEQATATYEEIRKANPALRTPMRPSPGYALAEGTRLSNPDLTALSENISTADPD